MAMERSTLIVSALAVMLLALATAPKVAATRSGAWCALPLQTCLGPPGSCLSGVVACLLSQE